MAGPAIGSREWHLAQNPNIFNASQGGVSGARNTPPSYRPGTSAPSAAVTSTTSRYDPLGQRTQYGTQSSPFYRDEYNSGAATGKAQNPATGKWDYVPAGMKYDQFGNLTPSPTTTTTTSGGGSGSGYGGGGGGAAMPNMSAIYSLMSSYKPQQFQWQNLDFQEYKPSKYRDFNTQQYDMMRSGLTDAIGADRASGMATYGDLRNEYAAYQDPFSAQNQITNPAQNAAMQRMMQANGVATDINQADTNRGVQADQAFGNVLALLSGVGQQNQDARLRAVGGDERRLNERLDAEQRGGTLAVGMAETRARELYEQEKWQFGEQVAQQNYANRMANAQYNNQGQNQTAQTNTQMQNEYYGGNVQSIIDLMAAGMATPSDMQMAATIGITPELVAQVNASKAAAPATGA